jgi:hypothetical protein
MRYHEGSHRLQFSMFNTLLASWTASTALAKVCRIGRYRHQVYANDKQRRWVTVFGLHWQVIETHRLEPAADLYGAITTAIERLAAEGWQIEAEPRFGFAFIRRDGERRLLTITSRDPYDNRPQSFTPFK